MFGMSGEDLLNFLSTKKKFFNHHFLNIIYWGYNPSSLSVFFLAYGTTYYVYGKTRNSSIKYGFESILNSLIWEVDFLSITVGLFFFVTNILSYRLSLHKYFVNFMTHFGVNVFNFVWEICFYIYLTQCIFV